VSVSGGMWSQRTGGLGSEFLRYYVLRPSTCCCPTWWPARKRDGASRIRNDRAAPSSSQRVVVSPMQAVLDCIGFPMVWSRWGDSSWREVGVSDLGLWYVGDRGRFGAPNLMSDRGWQPEIEE
jgi:hypothetical protein